MAQKGLTQNCNKIVCLMLEHYRYNLWCNGVAFVFASMKWNIHFESMLIHIPFILNNSHVNFTDPNHQSS